MATRKISDAEWQEHKPTISQLYLNDDWTLDMVIQEMSLFYGFYATKSQYTSKFKTWGLKKNSNDEFYKGIRAGLKRRRLDVCEAIIYHNDEHMPLKKLKKELQRHAFDIDHGVDDATFPLTPQGVDILPICSLDEPLQTPTIRVLTIALPWHTFIDSWNITISSPKLSSQVQHKASLLDTPSPDLAQYFQSFNDLNAPSEMCSPTFWGQDEYALSHGGIISDDVFEMTELENLKALHKNIRIYFGIKSFRMDDTTMKTLEKHLKPFVIERSAGETKRMTKDLMDSSSVASIRILTSYLALFLSNDLVTDHAINCFTDNLKKLDLFGNLRPLFGNNSPSSRAVLNQILHAAIDVGANKFLRQALASGADVESPSTGDDSKTLLQKSLSVHNREASLILIENGADVNTELSISRIGWTSKSLFYDDFFSCECVHHVDGFTCPCEITGERSPLSLAARSKKCVDLIPILLEKGASISRNDPILLRAILSQASVKIVRCLINAGANVNHCTMYQWSDVSTPLVAAAKAVNIEVVRVLLEAGADPNRPSAAEFGHLFTRADHIRSPIASPLVSALKKSEYVDQVGYVDRAFEVVELLLRYGANPNMPIVETIQDGYKYPHRMSGEWKWDWNFGECQLCCLYPLQVAARLGKLEILKLLVKYNAAINTEYGTPALAFTVEACHLETTRYLLSQGADPNGTKQHRQCISPLEAAVQTKNLEWIELLFASGASIHQYSMLNSGYGLLQRAARTGNQRIIEYLLQCGVSMQPPPGSEVKESVLEGFVLNQLHELVAQALAAGVSPDQPSKDAPSPLVAAISRNDLVALRLLLTAGANVHEYARVEMCYFDNEFFHDGHLFWEIEPPILSPIQWAAGLNHLEAARLLCEAGADVNQQPRNSEGNMALHLAARGDYVDMVRFLISRKADVNAYSTTVTALQECITAHSMKVVKILLRHGADPNLPSGDARWDISENVPYDSCMPLECACLQGDLYLVKLILGAGAHTDNADPLGFVLLAKNGACWEDEFELIEFLLEYGVDVNYRQFDRHSCLQAAILRPDSTCANLLLKAGANVNASASAGSRGVTALQAAASVGDVDMVEHLLSKGAYVNAPAAPVNGVTALQAASIKGYLRIAQILLEHDADIDAKGAMENGLTAIEGAAEFGRIDTVKLLLDNYHGNKSISEMCNIAHKAAKKGNQWFVMEMLNAYKPPNEELS